MFVCMFIVQIWSHAAGAGCLHVSLYKPMLFKAHLLTRNLSSCLFDVDWLLLLVLLVFIVTIEIFSFIIFIAIF